jgi:light-regulated signal transduction histidine kinase (bacteriophytochrome)
MSEGKIVRLYGNIMDITVQKQSEDELKKLKNDLEIIVAERTRELEEKIQKLNNSEKAMLYMVEDLNTMTGELKDKHNKLTEINQDLEAFSYSVFHDLRAPLRALNGFSRILLEDYSAALDDEGKRLLQVIGTNVKKMGMLIDDLLSFSRIGRQEITFSGIEMKSTAHEVFQELISDKDTIQFLLHDIPDAYGDASMIRQVWVNLIDNALKFTRGKENRKIEIGNIIDDRELIYYVRDNGAGFDMTYLHKLFGVFQRLHTESAFEGTGVGLAIVQRIILRMGGRVWAEGEINKGATFFFSIPVRI